MVGDRRSPELIVTVCNEFVILLLEVDEQVCNHLQTAAIFKASLMCQGDKTARLSQSAISLQKNCIKLAITCNVCVLIWYKLSTYT